MYIPPSFAETNQTTLFEFIERNNFGLLVSHGNSEPLATHLPFLLDRQDGQSGSLIGHMARVNPHWQAANRGVLIVFSGPHTYISPSWYESDNVVPTWNYVAVHVYGTLHVIEDEDATLKILRDFVTFHEKSMPTPWTLPNNEHFVKKLAESVVAFQVKISRMEGKWKLSQNHPRQRRERVIHALSSQRDENSQAIAAMMALALREQD
jgi:transcriptional regulator